MLSVTVQLTERGGGDYGLARATTATGASEEGLARGGTGRAVLSPPGFGGADGGIGRVLGGGLQVLIVAAQAAHHVLGGAGASNGGLNET